MNSSAQQAEAAANDKVLLEIAGGVATITLNRPEAGNALNMELTQSLTAAINRACDDPATRVVLLRATGKAFCVGGDIKAFEQHRDNLSGFIDSLLESLNQAVSRLATSGLPVITAVNGAVGGGGLGFALCGDFVLAASSMKLRCGYSAIGLTPDVGASWFLTRRVGATKAKHLFMLNESRTAQECLDLGIVDAVHPDAELDQRARELALQLSRGSRLAVARAKELVDIAGQQGITAHLQMERAHMVAAGGETDVQEGVAAFLEKRAPDFQ